MHRTTVMLSPVLKMRAYEHAKKAHLSLGELIRHALEAFLQRSDEEDDFLADRRVFSGQTPKDLSQNHDDYLYGDRS